MSSSSLQTLPPIRVAHEGDDDDDMVSESVPPRPPSPPRTAPARGIQTPRQRAAALKPRPVTTGDPFVRRVPDSATRLAQQHVTRLAGINNLSPRDLAAASHRRVAVRRKLDADAWVSVIQAGDTPRTARRSLASQDLAHGVRSADLADYSRIRACCALLTASATDPHHHPELLVPPSILPRDVHIVEDIKYLLPDVAAAGDTDIVVDQARRVLQKTVFPTATPSGRIEVVHLANALESLLSTTQQPALAQLLDAGTLSPSIHDTVHREEIVWDVVFAEVVRQVHVNCSERGLLLEQVRCHYVDSIGALLHICRRQHEQLLEYEVDEEDEDCVSQSTSAGGLSAMVRSKSRLRRSVGKLAVLEPPAEHPTKELEDEVARLRQELKQTQAQLWVIREERAFLEEQLDEYEGYTKKKKWLHIAGTEDITPILEEAEEIGRQRSENVKDEDLLSDVEVPSLPPDSDDSRGASPAADIDLDQLGSEGDPETAALLNEIGAPQSREMLVDIAIGMEAIVDKLEKQLEIVQEDSEKVSTSMADLIELLIKKKQRIGEAEAQTAAKQEALGRGISNELDAHAHLIVLRGRLQNIVERHEKWMLMETGEGGGGGGDDASTSSSTISRSPMLAAFASSQKKMSVEAMMALKVRNSWMKAQMRKITEAKGRAEKDAAVAKAELARIEAELEKLRTRVAEAESGILSTKVKGIVRSCMLNIVSLRARHTKLISDFRSHKRPVAATGDDQDAQAPHPDDDVRSLSSLDSDLENIFGMVEDFDESVDIDDDTSDPVPNSRPKRDIHRRRRDRRPRPAGKAKPGRSGSRRHRTVSRGRGSSSELTVVREDRAEDYAGGSDDDSDDSVYSDPGSDYDDESAAELAELGDDGDPDADSDAESGAEGRKERLLSMQLGNESEIDALLSQAQPRVRRDIKLRLRQLKLRKVRKAKHEAKRKMERERRRELRKRKASAVAEGQDPSEWDRELAASGEMRTSGSLGDADDFSDEFSSSDDDTEKHGGDANRDGNRGGGGGGGGARHDRGRKTGDSMPTVGADSDESEVDERTKLLRERKQLEEEHRTLMDQYKRNGAVVLDARQAVMFSKFLEEEIERKRLRARGGLAPEARRALNDTFNPLQASMYIEWEQDQQMLDNHDVDMIGQSLSEAAYTQGQPGDNRFVSEEQFHHEESESERARREGRVPANTSMTMTPEQIVGSMIMLPKAQAQKHLAAFAATREAVVVKEGEVSVVQSASAIGLEQEDFFQDTFEFRFGETTFDFKHRKTDFDFGRISGPIPRVMGMRPGKSNLTLSSGGEFFGGADLPQIPEPPEFDFGALPEPPSLVINAGSDGEADAVGEDDVEQAEEELLDDVLDEIMQALSDELVDETIDEVPIDGNGAVVPVLPDAPDLRTPWDGPPVRTLREELEEMLASTGGERAGPKVLPFAAFKALRHMRESVASRREERRVRTRDQYANKIVDAFKVPSGGGIKPKSLHWLRRLVRDIYHSKLYSDTRDDHFDAPHLRMPLYVYDFLKKRYGTRKLVEANCQALVVALRAYRSEELDVDAFGRFLEETWPLDLLNVFLKGMSLCQDVKVGPSYVNPGAAMAKVQYVDAERCAVVARVVLGTDRPAEMEQQLQDALAEMSEETPANAPRGRRVIGYPGGGTTGAGGGAGGRRVRQIEFLVLLCEHFEKQERLFRAHLSALFEQHVEGAERLTRSKFESLLRETDPLLAADGEKHWMTHQRHGYKSKMARDEFFDFATSTKVRGFFLRGFFERERGRRGSAGSDANTLGASDRGVALSAHDNTSALAHVREHWEAVVSLVPPERYKQVAAPSISALRDRIDGALQSNDGWLALRTYVRILALCLAHDRPGRLISLDTDRLRIPDWSVRSVEQDIGVLEKLVAGFSAGAGSGAGLAKSLSAVRINLGIVG